MKKAISILLALTFLTSQGYAGEAISSFSNGDKLAASLASDPNINPDRSKPLRNDIAGKAEPGAIGNGIPLMELAQGKLPQRLYLPDNEYQEIAQKLSEAIDLAIKLNVANQNKVSPQHQARAKQALGNLIILQSSLTKDAYLYNADIRSPEDYLVGFNFQNYRGFAVELINSLYNISPKRLAQYVYHECVPEKEGITAERDDHRVIYNEIQSAIFGQDEVLALKKDLREFINSRSESICYDGFFSYAVGELPSAEYFDEFVHHGSGEERYDKYVYLARALGSYKNPAAIPALKKCLHVVSERYEGSIFENDNYRLYSAAIGAIKNIAIATIRSWESDDATIKEIIDILTESAKTTEVREEAIKGVNEIIAEKSERYKKFPARSEPIQNDTTDKAKPGAIGNGIPLMLLAHGELPKTAYKPDYESQELSEAIGLAIKLSVANQNKVPPQHQARAKQALDNLIRLQKNPTEYAHLYNADVSSTEDYLLGFNRRNYLFGFAEELIYNLYRISPKRLAQYVYHECVPEKEGITAERDDHRVIYNEIQSAIFGQDEVLALKKDLREFINSRSRPINDEISLATENLENALHRIDQAQTLDEKQKRELEDILKTIFSKALPYFKKCAHDNPVYHHTQVLDNMVRIGVGEGFLYKELKNAVILALLHDIGNAISEKTRVRSSQIKDAIKAGDKEKAVTLAKMAIDFRLEHMTRGPELAREILNQLLRNELVSEEDIALVCEAIKIHDNPSIENVVKEMNKLGVNMPYSSGEFLFTFDNSALSKLISYLREADRLFMVSYQGVVTDLMSGKKDITPKNIMEKLDSNIRAHEEEYGLYAEAHKDDGKFINKTLYRTRTGYGIFINARLEALVKPLLSKGRIIIESKDGEQFIFTYEQFTANWLNREWGILALVAIDGKKISKTYFHFRMDRSEKIAYIDTSYEWSVGVDVDEPPDAYDDWNRFTITNSDTIYHAINVRDEVKGEYRGVGAALMSLGLAIAKEKGMNKMIMREHTYAPEFYEKMGFSLTRGPGGRGESGEFDLINSTIPTIMIKRKEGSNQKNVVPPLQVSMTQISEDLPVRAQVFKTNLTRILAEHPDQLFFMGIENDIGESQKAQIMPIYKAIDEIKELKDANGKPLFPNLMVRREKAEELVKIAADLAREGKLNFNNTFIGARKASVDNKLYDSIKGEGRAWISAIDDLKSGDYLPVFEAITLNMMAYLNADLTAIKNFYDTISDKPIDPDKLQDMIRNRIIYILPKATALDTKQLRELYELARQVYIAA